MLVIILLLKPPSNNVETCILFCHLIHSELVITAPATIRRLTGRWMRSGIGIRRIIPSAGSGSTWSTKVTGMKIKKRLGCKNHGEMWAMLNLCLNYDSLSALGLKYSGDLITIPSRTKIADSISSSFKIKIMLFIKIMKYWNSQLSTKASFLLTRHRWLITRRCCKSLPRQKLWRNQAQQRWWQMYLTHHHQSWRLNWRRWRTMWKNIRSIIL